MKQVSLIASRVLRVVRVSCVAFHEVFSNRQTPTDTTVTSNILKLSYYVPLLVKNRHKLWRSSSDVA